MQLIDERIVDALTRESHCEHDYILEDAWNLYRNPDGLIKALVASCQKDSNARPWIAKSSYHFIIEMAFGNGGRARGRCGNLVARYKQDQIHHRRASEVDDILRQQELHLEARKEFKEDAGSGKRLNYKKQQEISRNEAYLAAFGNGKKGARRATGRMGELRNDACSSQSVARSCRLVAEQPPRFLPPSNSLMHLLGLPSPICSPSRNFEAILLEGKMLRSVEKRAYSPASNQAPPELLSASARERLPSPSATPVPPPSEATQTRKEIKFEASTEQLESAIRGGNVLALLEALYPLVVDFKPAPAWLARHTLRYVLTLINPKSLSHRGRLGSVRSQCREELKHFIRCMALGSARQLQELRLQNWRLDDPASVDCPIRTARLSPRRSMRDAFTIASGWLAGTSWESSPDLIKKSRRKLLKDKGLGERFWPPSSLFSRQRIEGVWSEKMGKEYEYLITQIHEAMFATISASPSESGRRPQQWRKKIRTV